MIRPLAIRIVGFLTVALGCAGLARAEGETVAVPPEILKQAAALEAGKGGAAGALPSLEEAARLRSIAGGANDSDLALVLTDLALVYKAAGDLKSADRAMARLKQWMAGARDADMLRLAGAQSSLAAVYREYGNRTRTVDLDTLALTIRRTFLGEENLQVASSLADLGLAYEEMDDFKSAKPLYEEALRLRTQLLQNDDLLIATSSYNLATALREFGDLKDATRLYGTALEIRTTKLGPRDLEVAAVLNGMGILAWDSGSYGVGEQMLRRALAIRQEKAPNGVELADSLLTLGTVCSDKGDYDEAEKLIRQALAKFESATGPWSSRMISALNALAVLEAQKGDNLSAIAFYDEALRTALRVTYAPLPTAYLMCNFASALRHDGKYEDAIAKYRSCIARLSGVLGEKTPPVAAAMNGLAAVYGEIGDYAQAEALEKQALGIQRDTLGVANADVALTMGNIAATLRADNQLNRAVGAANASAQIEEHVLSMLLGEGASRDKRAYFETLAPSTYEILSLHLLSMPGDARAERLAFETLLRRKGRVLDAETDTIVNVRRHAAPEDLASLDKLRETRTEIAGRVLHGEESRGSGHGLSTADLAAQADVIERDLARRYPGIAPESAPVTLEAVQARLGPSQALVEFGLYAAVPSTSEQLRTHLAPPEYVAYVLPSRGPSSFVRLGPRDPIDTLARDFLAALKAQGPHRDLARRLDAALMAKVRPLLGDRHDVILSPDGALSLVPFASLLDDKGQYLITRYRFTYVTSGRDLLREPRAPRGGSVIVANPDFGPPGPRAPALQGTQGIGPFAPLAGADSEADVVRRLLPQSTLLHGAEATKVALLALHGPRILHVATHGFFADASPDEPLLGAGIALANANVVDASGDSGVLTALEASSMDLWGTELVALSACDTAQGTVKIGDGIYGLRRALVLAGSQTQMLTLWQVDDALTRDLLRSYYEGLMSGEGRSESLRAAQLKLLANTATSHPFYWAAFTVSGEGGPLPDAPAQAPKKVAPGTRGCACSTVTQSRADDAPGGVPSSCAAAAAAVFFLRRRAQARSTPRSHVGNEGPASHG